MMSSYLVIGLAAQFILQNQLANLADLIRLGQPAPRLHVDDFLNAVLREDVMAALHSLAKSESSQQVTEIVEGDVRIRFAK